MKMKGCPNWKGKTLRRTKQKKRDRRTAQSNTKQLETTKQVMKNTAIQSKFHMKSLRINTERNRMENIVEFP